MGTERSVQLTAEGQKRLEAELIELRDVRLRDLFRNIQDANTNNEASDSGEYEEQKEELVYTEARVRDLEQLLRNAETLKGGSPNGVVALGSRVTVKFDDGESDTWTVVTPEEASLPDGSVSTDSPVGQALLGSKEGDAVTVITPGGEVNYTVVAVK
ncbi:MAG: GreA/GreB family elongation factor [Chloroflexia bacterium]|nr:GreA/GreB family elongation factor [Chloroflexia bacterium]